MVFSVPQLVPLDATDRLAGAATARTAIETRGIAVRVAAAVSTRARGGVTPRRPARRAFFRVRAPIGRSPTQRGCRSGVSPTRLSTRRPQIEDRLPSPSAFSWARTPSLPPLAHFRQRVEKFGGGMHRRQNKHAVEPERPQRGRRCLIPRQRSARRRSYARHNAVRHLFGSSAAGTLGRRLHARGDHDRDVACRIRGFVDVTNGYLNGPCAVALARFGCRLNCRLRRRRLWQLARLPLARSTQFPICPGVCNPRSSWGARCRPETPELGESRATRVLPPWGRRRGRRVGWGRYPESERSPPSFRPVSQAAERTR